MTSSRTRRGLAAALLPLALLAGCGGGGSSSDEACSTAEQKSWLTDYMNEWYFWYRLSPRPNPERYDTVQAYFFDLLYNGTSVDFPADRWSFTETTESFNRFFGDGETLGYGVSVAGLEVENQPNAPLYVRYVEPASPAAAQGIARGDQVVSINNRSSFDVISANDFAALSSTTAGQTVTLVLRRNGLDRTVTLTSAVYALTPVTARTVVTSPGGRKMGYLVVKDMISQANAPLETAFAFFRTENVSEIVLDLRYNGGGLVSVANTVASYIAGTRGNGRAFASLLYNDKRAAIDNRRFAFENRTSAAGVARVFVLMGERTCSASEQVINGLRGVGVDVVAIGGTTCGKPVGFLPKDYCSITYNAVNFESVNDRNEGRYFDGFAPTCPVAEDFTRPLGSLSEPLLASAATYADTGACPAVAQGLKQPLSVRPKRHLKPEPGEWQGMLGR